MKSVCYDETTAMEVIKMLNTLLWSITGSQERVVPLPHQVFVGIHGSVAQMSA